jgi:hypothetical protein
MKTMLFTFCSLVLLAMGCEKGAATKPAEPVTLYYEAPTITVVAPNRTHAPAKQDLLAKKTQSPQPGTLLSAPALQ